MVVNAKRLWLAFGDPEICRLSATLESHGMIAVTPKKKKKFAT